MHAIVRPVENTRPLVVCTMHGPRLMSAIVRGKCALGWEFVGGPYRWIVDRVPCRVLCFDRGNERLNIYVSLHP